MKEFRFKHLLGIFVLALGLACIGIIIKFKTLLIVVGIYLIFTGIHMIKGDE